MIVTTSFSFCHSIEVDGKTWMNKETNSYMLYKNLKTYNKGVDSKSLHIEDCNFINVKLKILAKNISFVTSSFKNSSLLTYGNGTSVKFCQSIWSAKQGSEIVISHYKILVFWKCLFHNFGSRNNKPIMLLYDIENIFVVFCSFVNISGSMMTVNKNLMVHFRKSLVKNVSSIESSYDLH